MKKVVLPVFVILMMFSISILFLVKNISPVKLHNNEKNYKKMNTNNARSMWFIIN